MIGLRQPGSRRLVSTAGLLLLIALMAIGSTPANAAPGAAEDDQFASVEIELVGSPPQGNEQVADARIIVETSRAISGTLLVIDDTPGQSATTYEFDIDLGANSVATFPVTFLSTWQGLDISASLSSNGVVIATDDVNNFPVGWADGGSVGVLGIEVPPQRVPELDGEKQLSTLVLDDQLRGLDRMTSVVALPAAIRELGPEQALQLDAWTLGGGQLVIDGPSRSIGDSYHQVPTANPDRFGFGAGSVLYLEDWEAGLPVGGYLGTQALQNLANNQNLARGASGELALLANISLPAVAIIAGVLLLYSLLAGPILFSVLGSRGMQRRMWTLLPLLSLVFAVGILGFGFVSRSGRSEVHVTIVEVNPQGSRATSNLLLTSNFGGSREFETPDGWSYLGQGRSNGQRPVKLRVGATSTEVSFDMPPGSNAIARLSGLATEFDGLLTINDPTLAGDVVTAQVSNNSTADITDAVAFLGNAREEIGDIPAGETVSISIEWGDHSNRTMKELLIWPRANRFDEFGQRPARIQDDDATTAAGAWAEWRISQGTTASPDDVLGIVGWSDEFSSPVSGVDKGRTALFTRTNVASIGPEVGFRTVSRLSSNQRPIFEGNFSGYTEDYRVTLAPDADLERLSIGVLNHSSAVAMMTADGWRYLDLPDNGGVDLAVPPEAIIDGEITIRSYVPEWIWAEGASVLMTVDAEDRELSKLSDELNFRNSNGDDFFPEERFDNEMRRDVDEERRVELVELVPGEQILDGGLTGPGTYHAYIVTLEEGQGLVVTMGSGQGDSYLELLGPDGDLVASNDDYGRGVDSQIQIEAGVAGEYEIRAMDLSIGSIEYEIAVELTE